MFLTYINLIIERFVETGVFSLPTSGFDRFQNKTSVSSFHMFICALHTVRGMLDSSSLVSGQARQAKNTAKPSFCRICHAEAKIVNYGVLSCNSCKTFFRRHSHASKVSVESSARAMIVRSGLSRDFVHAVGKIVARSTWPRGSHVYIADWKSVERWECPRI